jgi:plastocyanin
MRSAVLTALTCALAASAANITVQVGAGGLNFNPTNVKAAVDDMIIFQFVGGTHSVTQSTFGAPCQNMTPPGVDSGIKTTAAGATQFEQWAFKVDKTDPLWFYCRVGQHCANGMVFAVNPTADKTYDQFSANAKGSGASPSGSSSGGGSGAPPSPTGSGGSSAPSPRPSNGALQMTGNGAVGILTALGLLAGLTL